MLSCRDVNEHASALLDNELGWRRRLAMQLHLMMCRHCRRFVAQLDCLMRALRAGPDKAEPAAADAYVEQIMAALPPKKPF